MQILNNIEMEIEKYKRNWSLEGDISLWKNDKGKYKKVFSTRETWFCIREKHNLCSWHKMIWFKHTTPRYAFVTWMAVRGRLSTGDRMKQWNVDADAVCKLCQEPIETLCHLFFDCAYSTQVWEALMKGILRDQYTTRWERLVHMITEGDSSWSKVKIFTVRYMLQSTVHMLWRERNKRRHGEPPSPEAVLIKRLDKNMRNMFTVIQRRGDKEYKNGLEFWFGTH